MSMRRPKRIAIVGGGPGGLTLANGLLGTGKSSLPPFFEEVAVFDRFNELRPGTGGGIQINGGAAVLAELGFRDELKESGLPMRRVVSRRAGMGTKLLDLDVAEAFQNSASSWLVQPGGEKGDANGQDVMSLTIMRDELSRMLAAKLPPGTLRFGKELVGIEKAAEGQSREGLVCVFADGSKSEAFDLVVGCDGINSKVREWVLESSSGEAKGNEEDEPDKQGLKTSSGLKIQFGVGPSGSRPPSSVGEMRQWFSSDGAYALTATYGGVGGELFDMVALTTYCDEDEDGEEKRDQQGASSSLSSSPPKKRSRRANPNWDTAQVQGECLERLREGQFPAEVVNVASSATRFFDVGVEFKDPLVPWSRREANGAAAVLLGDAAHAMPPFLGQGANQAIQDAYCLSLELAKAAPGAGGGGDVLGKALSSYEAQRKPATTLLMLESRFLGALETQRGLGGVLRDVFFFVTDKVGVAKAVFLKGAEPRVPLKPTSR